MISLQRDLPASPPRDLLVRQSIWPPGQAAWAGGLWLRRMRRPSGLVAVTVPSGSRTIPHPHRCTAIKW